jgi:thymidylate synthase
MSLYDKIYLDIANKILTTGYYCSNRTKIKTLKLPHQIMQFNLQNEFPILTTKYIAFKTAIKELLWIFQEQSNDIAKLHEKNVHIWDEWAMQDNTIGTSYGWIVRKFDQTNKLLDDLKNNSQSRRMLISLWQNSYLNTGALYPCCFLTMWDVTDGFLNCMLVQRSGDWGLGVPFNTTQYAVLVYLFAQVSNLKPGLLTHVINNAHIYENQIDAIKLQLGRNDFPAPKIIINPEIKNFYDFTIDDINLINYKYHPKIKMQVAV